MKESSENTIVQINIGTIIKTVLVLVFCYVLYLLSDIVLVVLTSIVVASALEPATRFLIKKKIPRVLSVLIVYVVFLSAFGGVCYLFIPPLLQDFAKFLGALPQYLIFLDKWNPWTDVVDYQIIFKSIVSEFGVIPSAGQDVAGDVAKTFGSIVHGLTNLILILVLSFYFAVQEKGIENFLKIIVPLKNEKYVIDLWYRSQHKIGKWMQGQIILGLTVGTLVYLLLTILGVPNALFLAIIAAVFELIPVFGPIISAIPAIMIGFSISATLGFGVLLVYIVIQQFENHLIYPVVVRSVVGVPPIMVILALIIGFNLAGIMGIILSVPLASALMEFVNDLEKKKISTAA